MQTAQSVTFVNIRDESSVLGTPLPPSAVYDSAKKASYFEQAFAIEALVGAGCFGNVFRVKSKEDNGLYAVKIAREAYRGTTDRAQKLEEVRKHQLLLPHSNCVHFYQSWEEKGRLYQQFELCETSLMELSESEHEISESKIWNYLVDLLLAVEHLHDHGLIHMDIKPENIFIGMDGRAKLGDFGLVIDLAKDDTANAVEGDPRYLATEILESRMFTKAADIFSLGVTILELACDLDLPKHGPLWHKLRKEGPDPALLTRLSHDLRRIIQLMMTNYIDRRPTVKQMLKLPAVQKAVKRRQRQLAWAEFLQSIKHWFTPFVLLAVWIWTYAVVVPGQKTRSFVEKLYYGDQSKKTPPNSILSPDDDKFKCPQLPEVSSTDHLAKFYIGDKTISSTLPDDCTNSELSNSFLDKSSSSHQNSPLARPLTLNFSDDSDDESQMTAPGGVNDENVAPQGSTPKLARSTPGTAGSAGSSLRFRQRLLANGGADGSPTTGLSSPKKRLDFDKFDSSPSTSSRAALNNEGSPKLVKRTPVRKPGPESATLSGRRGSPFVHHNQSSDDEQDMMNTPRSHSRKTKVHFHRSRLSSSQFNQDDDDDNLTEIKPLSLVAKFDAFSDDTENDE